jgi:hypothetical protein
MFGGTVDSEGRSRLGATLIAVAGTLLGALVGAVITPLVTKWKEEEARKQKSKQRAYEDFAALIVLPDEFRETRKYFDQLGRAIAAMDLYATVDVRARALATYNLALQRDEHEEGSEEYQRITANLERIRREFIEEARKDLGFPPIKFPAE